MAIQRSKREDRVLGSASADSNREALDMTLRPRTLQEYVGQRRITSRLLIHIEAAKKRGETLGHTLFHGPPGLGKTTLACILAREMESQLRLTSGPALEKPGDLASILSNLQEGDVLFIDEIHRLRPVVEEILYSAMEDFAIDLVLGKGPAARSMRLTLKPFTLLGATTKAGAMSAPLRDRFLSEFKLAFYERAEMERIVLRTASLLHMDIAASAAHRIAGSSRATPRVANRLVRAVRDFTQVRSLQTIDLAVVEEALDALDIDGDGLDATDRRILSTLIDDFGGGPVGLSTIAAILGDEEETIESVHEPFLLQQGYLQRTPKGRVAARRAYEKLGREMPEKSSTQAAGSMQVSMFG